MLQVDTESNLQVVEATEVVRLQNELEQGSPANGSPHLLTRKEPPSARLGGKKRCHSLFLLAKARLSG